MGVAKLIYSAGQELGSIEACYFDGFDWTVYVEAFLLILCIRMQLIFSG